MKAREARRIATEQGLAVAVVLRRQRAELRAMHVKLAIARSETRTADRRAGRLRAAVTEMLCNLVEMIGPPLGDRDRGFHNLANILSARVAELRAEQARLDAAVDLADAVSRLTHKGAGR